MSTYIYKRFETPSRYYEIVITKDILGDLTLETTYGGKANNRGKRTTIAVGDSIDGKLMEVEKLRKKHGYLMTRCRSLQAPQQERACS